jgi:hypothetical protein
MATLAGCHSIPVCRAMAGDEVELLEVEAVAYTKRGSKVIS